MGVSLEAIGPPGESKHAPAITQKTSLPDSPSASVEATQNAKSLSPNIAPVLAPPSFLSPSSTSARATSTLPARVAQCPRPRIRHSAPFSVSDAPFSDPMLLPSANKSSRPTVTLVNTTSRRSSSGRFVAGGDSHQSASATSARVVHSKSSRATVFRVESAEGAGNLCPRSKPLVHRMSTSISATSEGAMRRRHVSKKHWSMASELGQTRQGPDVYFSAAPFSEASACDAPPTPSRKGSPRPTVFRIQPESSTPPVVRSFSAASYRSPFRGKASPGRASVTSPWMSRPHTSHGPRRPVTPGTLKRPSTSHCHSHRTASQGKVSFSPAVPVRIKSCRSWDASDSKAEGAKSREAPAPEQPIAMSKSDDTTPGHSGPLGPGGLSTCLEDADLPDLAALLEEEEEEEEDDLFGLGKDKAADVSSSTIDVREATKDGRVEVEAKAAPPVVAASEAFAERSSDLDPSTTKRWPSPGPASHVQANPCTSMSMEQETSGKQGRREEGKEAGTTSDGGQGPSPEGQEGEAEQKITAILPPSCSSGGEMDGGTPTSGVTIREDTSGGAVAQRPGTGRRMVLLWRSVTGRLRDGRGGGQEVGKTGSAAQGPKMVEASASGVQASITCLGC